MIIETLLTKIDSSIASTEAPVRPRRLGRRLMLSAAVSGLALAGFSKLSEAFSVTAAPTQPAAAAVAPASVTPAVPHLEYLRAAPCAAELRDWAAFRTRFICADGRVVDTYNHGDSHTEAQGLGMLFAVTCDDRVTFDRIWNFTASHLRRRSDALFSWRYVPGSTNHVPDTNNATDGDIYIAAALVRASSRWNDAGYLAAARAISRDILKLLVREVGGRTVLLPGAFGFEAADHAVVNASYMVFPLLAELADAWDSPLWAKLIADGHRLVADAQFGRWRLPPDWLRVSARDGSLSLAERQPPRFSFDAVRIPLFLAWDGGTPQALQRFAAFWGANPAAAPAWIDLTTGACAPYSACGGVIAIARLIGREPHQRIQAELPAIAQSDDYYSAALILLSRLAMRETAFATV